MTLKMLQSICQQIWKTQQWPQDWKRLIFIPIPKKGNAKECSNYHTYMYICICIYICIHAGAKWLQSCLTLCDPIDGLLPGSPVPGILQARTLEWVAISFSNVYIRRYIYMYVYVYICIFILYICLYNATKS